MCRSTNCKEVMDERNFQGGKKDKETNIAEKDSAGSNIVWHN